MKPLIQWHIQKHIQYYKKKLVWEHWDGPFKTEKIARKKFDNSYRNTGGETKQHFRVVKLICEPMPFIFKEIEHDT